MSQCGTRAVKTFQGQERVLVFSDNLVYLVRYSSNLGTGTKSENVGYTPETVKVSNTNFIRELSENDVSVCQCLFCVFILVFTALKIQVSGATADLLHSLKGYVLTCRGTLNVKVRKHLVSF